MDTVGIVFIGAGELVGEDKSWSGGIVGVITSGVSLDGRIIGGQAGSDVGAVVGAVVGTVIGAALWSMTASWMVSDSLLD